MKENFSRYIRAFSALSLLFSSACQAYGYKNIPHDTLPTTPTPNVLFDPTLTPEFKDYLDPEGLVQPSDLVIIDNPSENPNVDSDQFESITGKDTFITFLADGVLISDKTGLLQAINTTYLQELITENQLDNNLIKITMTKSLSQTTSNGKRDVEGKFVAGESNYFFVYVNLYGPTAKDLYEVESENWWLFQHLFTPCILEHEFAHAYLYFLPQSTPLSDVEHEAYAVEISNQCLDQQANKPRLMFIVSDPNESDRDDIEPFDPNIKIQNDIQKSWGVPRTNPPNMLPAY